MAGVPMLSNAVVLTLWGTFAPMVQTLLGSIPRPGAVWAEVISLNQDAADKAVKEAGFYSQVAQRNAKLVADGRTDEVMDMIYTDTPSYYDQIWTSIKTLFFVFTLASLIAVPRGILAGLSPTANAALNPLIQISNPSRPSPGCPS